MRNQLTSSLCLLFLVTAIAACGVDSPPPPPAACPEGLMQAQDGTCEEPLPTCDSEIPGSIVEACAAEGRVCFEDSFGAVCGVCRAGLVQERGICRDPVRCSDLDCVGEARDCIDSDGGVDARCGPCVAGHGEQGKLCVARTCSRDGGEGSIAGTCAASNRFCLEGGEEEARCGGCFPGFTEERGECRQVRDCAELGCFSANRACTPAESHADATCGGCRAGFKKVGGRCLPIQAATCFDDGSAESILQACHAEGRDCVPGEGGATCGGCTGDLVEDGRTRACTAFSGCEGLDCASEQRSCVEDPQGRCAGCLPGFVEDLSTGTCRSVRTCSQLSCSSDQQCAEATDETDAFCHPTCATREIWGGTQCTPCAPCDGEGEAGVWPAPSAAGTCMCKTLPGYFYSSAGDVGTFRCDADGDGWVRESARLAMESNDPALRANARCTLLTIDRILLVNEAGQEKEVVLDEPLALYETDRNDDPAVLAVHWNRKGLPPYRVDGSIVPAHELNRFTKLCHDARADYNDNGIPDVQDWSDHSLGPAMRPEQRPFNEFSYFAELAEGHFEPASGSARHGRWVIQEKVRDPATSSFVSPIAISYPQEAGTYWRQCEVRQDPRWGKVSAPVGMDFARYSDSKSQTFTGMNHHSQFKCLLVRDQVQAGSLYEFTPSSLATEKFALNRCRAKAGPETEGSARFIECEPVRNADVRPGDVFWGAVPYADYGPTPFVSPAALAYFDSIESAWGVQVDVTAGATDYRGGCVNACERELPSCPGFDRNPAAVSCHRDVNDSGRFAGCGAMELCDGIDNRGDGAGIDVNTIEEGYACGVDPATGGHGVCGEGTSACIAGQITCVSNLQPSVEICDGKDNNCDGEVDESFPTEGHACDVLDPNWGGDPNSDPYLKGRCKTGRQICTPTGDGAEIFCEQTYQPRAESCTTATDDDCDGNPYTEGGNPENIAGCVNYYYDEDGDGFPASNTQPKCFCPNYPAQLRGKYTVREPAGGPSEIRWDCCDIDTNVRPTQNSFFSLPNKCGNYEYNCDNKYEEKEITTVASSCKKKSAGFECYLETPGWKNAAPACGQKGQLHTDCSFAHPVGSSCNETQTSRTQRCK